MKPNDTFVPFSNGHEYRMFLARNCEGCRKYKPEATSSRDGCPMEVALAIGSLGDGNMKAKHGLRCGLCVEGPNGEIVERPCDVIPACPERRGFDEPDDRPRRGPRPPKGQTDLLDPRNVPDRSGVRS